MRKTYSCLIITLILLLSCIVSGCGSASGTPASSFDDSNTALSATIPGERDNTPVCLIPVATGIKVFSNDVCTIDVSNSAEGYIMAKYIGNCPKVKFQITGPDAITYTYDLSGKLEAFPLTSGNGSYLFAIYENVSGNQYATVLSESYDVSITNEFGPYLYPNQYVDFTSDCETVAKGADLAAPANTDLDVVSNVYNYIIQNITYDYSKADNVESGYLCNVDAILNSKTGICLDYAAIMASMLRSQRIPTKLEVGYAGEAYHAWISTYISDIGWVNGIIEFDGTNWQLMDPTFGASTNEKELKKYIGEGDNYITKYIY